MSLLITLLAYLAVIGILWWAITQIPLPQPFRIIAVVVIAVVSIFLLLSLVQGGVPAVHALRLT
jgi:hypothetical protein